MDYKARSSSLIVDRLIKGRTSWPENSRGFWMQAEQDNPMYFNRHALCTGFWSPGPSEYKTIEFWDDVPSTLVNKWMDRFRLLMVQADELSWAGLWAMGNGRWEQQWLQTLMKGELVVL